MTERADTAWLRSIARNTWDDSVSNAVFIAAAELETLRAATQEARDMLAHMLSGEPFEECEVNRVMALLDAKLRIPPDPAA